MATLRGAAALSKAIQPLLARRGISASAVLANWNKDWKPGPFPKSAEERAAAAKRYGLRVEDYDVYDNDGMGYGDYPKLPVVSGDAKSPYEDWDIPELKRNFNEPLHVWADIIGEDRWDANAKPRYSYLNMFLTLTAFLGTLGTIYFLTLPYPLFLPAMPKQYPFNGLHLENGGNPDEEKAVVHYTFEPSN
ncbi:NADH dehydrogenase [ubiquinone] 1 beta subcomplex subunit 8, mitochondrial-like [Babylonia areolata]|uniref:NADH dehydrogenase [ubiquinone] 1 beta subcomplex subunit 8, mitochondrial-like n=1 Tax=Babylonia areolata TaxID=304850 RepID=UPI003FD07DA8